MECQNISILVVDDNIMNQKLAQFILKQMNYYCDLANDGNEAYQLYKENRYDVIFMDIQMPILDGLETTKKIRQLEKESDGKKAQIFAVTASDHVDDYQEKGLDGVVFKPLQKEMLLDILTQLN